MTRPGAEHEPSATRPSGSEVADALVELRTRPLDGDRAAAAQHLLVAATAAVLERDEATSPTLAAYRALARSGDGSGTARVPGDPHGYEARDAAFLLAVGATSCSEDRPHPAPVLAAAIVTAGQVDADRDALVRATVIGLEVLHRLAGAADEDHDWDPTGSAGILAAALAVGELLGLDADRLANAIGVAGSSTVGLDRAAGPRSRAVHAGKAAANGVLAATLAARGFTAPLDALGAPRGYFGVLFPERPPRARTAQVLDGLGATWRHPLRRSAATTTLPVGVVGLPRALAGPMTSDESSDR